MVGLSDLMNGPKMFRSAFGPLWGKRMWRAFFVAVAIGIVAAALTQVGQFGHGVLFGFGSDPSSTIQNCAVTGGINYGAIQQNCDRSSR
jgi:hypothetical protein